jgi:hypothetical protein
MDPVFFISFPGFKIAARLYFILSQILGLKVQEGKVVLVNN